MQNGNGSRPIGRETEVAAEAAFATLYRRHASAVMAYALRRCSPDDAADVVSETFVVAWRRFEELPDEPAVKPWLLGVARRVLANQRRSIRRRGDLVKKLSASMAPRFEELSIPAGREEALVVTEALAKLSKRDQELLLLTAWEELTPSEIALMLDLSSGVVRKRLFRARARLIAAAGQLDGESDLGKSPQPRPGQTEGQDPALLAVRKRATAW